MPDSMSNPLDSSSIVRPVSPAVFPNDEEGVLRKFRRSGLTAAVIREFDGGLSEFEGVGDNEVNAALRDLQRHPLHRCISGGGIAVRSAKIARGRQK